MVAGNVVNGHSNVTVAIITFRLYSDMHARSSSCRLSFLSLFAHVVMSLKTLKKFFDQIIANYPSNANEEKGFSKKYKIMVLPKI